MTLGLEVRSGSVFAPHQSRVNLKSSYMIGDGCTASFGLRYVELSVAFVKIWKKNRAREC